jgi:tight adherence protein C
LAGAIDLLTLMIEVGGNFQESLQMVAERLQTTPLGSELNKIISDTAAGTPRREALRGFAERVDDDDARELVFAIVQGEELGTPLAAILRRQANQMRQKRSQWAEKAAEEAQVNIVFPAMVIMVACLIIVAAPFIINALTS